MAKKKVKKKHVIHHSKILKNKKKKVKRGHPLAKLKKHKKHPLHDDIEVEDSDFADQVEDVADIDVDFESAADPMFEPSLQDDSIIALPEMALESTTTLDVPTNVTVDISNPLVYAASDGTNRVSLKINFDEIFRADDYEIRISDG